LLKNKFLIDVLKKHGQDSDSVWKSIIMQRGSVQHLDFLTQDERDTFKTAVEINQAWLIEHAAERQEFICQSQSLNLFFPPDVNKGDLHNAHMLAWAKKPKNALLFT
jgi:ribonucleoside-diphosphate reductase alpha chain